MNQELQQLIEISHFYGRNKDFVIAGGGNTSLKDDECLWIKSSGISLAEIDEDGFVVLSRKSLGKIAQKTYSNNPQIREEEVKEDLNSCILSKTGRRPSVETSLHDLMDYKYIVHTHPTLVNAVMCSQKAAEYTRDLFGEEALFVEYTDPGYTLFKKIFDKIALYKQQYNRTPNLLFLENHGIFVAADTIDEIKKYYDFVVEQITKSLKVTLPDSAEIRNDELCELANELNGFNSMIAIPKTSNLIKTFTLNNEAFSPVSTPFSPDHIVYCKSKYLFAEEPSAALIKEEISSFNIKNGYLPKVIAVKGLGLIIMEESEKAAGNVIDLFENMMEICLMASSFGGPQAMTAIQIAFIDNWEVENYRRKVAKQN
ncbi:MAG: class II aldolase/adducin family protein [Bacteroidota bacterium]|nr:class II aldolase/adducin family protein [Bacteroidota bacterium]